MKDFCDYIIQDVIHRFMREGIKLLPCSSDLGLDIYSTAIHTASSNPQEQWLVPCGFYSPEDVAAQKKYDSVYTSLP